MILELAYYGNPILRKKGQSIPEVTDEIRQLVADMIETMHSLKGIGIAAPQVKRSLALFVTEVPKFVGKERADDDDDEDRDEDWEPGELIVYINPKIIAVSEELNIREEGCLSIPGLRYDVVRPSGLKVQAMDLEGKIFEREFEGLHARAVMHENDHINGVLFIDRVHGRDRKSLDVKLNQIKKRFS